MSVYSPRGQFKKWFPRSAANMTSIKLTSPIDGYYNCVAWALQITNRWMQPVDHPVLVSYWPVPREGTTVAAYSKMFQHYQFVECDDGQLEIGYEKIVIYGNATSKFTHVARQLADGKWTSKIGGESDITHHDPDTLTSKLYGYPQLYMKRPIKA